MDELKNWNYFIGRDPYNKQNVVEGYISMVRNDKYGALKLTKVNDVPVDNEIIFCTPKMHYPYVMNVLQPNKIDFNKNINYIERYTKLDGTNIFAFSYKDSEENQFVSYKTRLRPFISENSIYGNFYDMWNKMLEKYNHNGFIERVVLEKNITLSFELWGSRNPHLIRYDTPLEATLLFGRKNNGEIIPPTAMNEELWQVKLAVGTMGFPVSECLGRMYNNFDESYKKVQGEIEKELKDLGDEEYAGQEGEIWYALLNTGEWVQYKLKPETIEKIHFSAGGINKATIRAACYKAYESATDKPTVDDVINILDEDFSSHEVQKVYYGITTALKETEALYKFREKVREEYQKILNDGLNINENKSDVMRRMSQCFSKIDMQRVFATINTI